VMQVLEIAAGSARVLAERGGLGLGGVCLRAEGCMSKTVYVLNGPNLNLLGQRQPEIYGAETLADVEAACRAAAEAAGLGLDFRQSNHEGVLVDWIHEARAGAVGIVINPGAYSHTSIAILDALNAYAGPVIEVHVSNIHRREAFRQHSYVSLRADGVIAGCGTEGYVLALRRLWSGSRHFIRALKTSRRPTSRLMSSN